MVAANVCAPSLKTLFLALLPKIQLHGRIFFRHLKCLHKKEDALAEMVALAWKWFFRLVEQGKDPSAFPTVIATFAAKAVYNGRKLCGIEKANDVFSSRAQRLHGFTTVPLPNGSSLHGNVFDDALADNARSPVPDQVAFRIDFPRWLKTLCRRDRRLVELMTLGHSTKWLAHRFNLTPGRVSQLRSQFQHEWAVFQNEMVPISDGEPA